MKFIIDFIKRHRSKKASNLFLWVIAAVNLVLGVAAITLGVKG